MYLYETYLPVDMKLYANLQGNQSDHNMDIFLLRRRQFKEQDKSSDVKQQLPFSDANKVIHYLK